MMFNFICKGNQFTILSSQEGLDDFAFDMGWRITDQLDARDASLITRHCPIEDPDYIPADTWRDMMHNLRYQDAHNLESYRG